MIRKSPISMIMTTPVITLQKEDKLEAAQHIFRKHQIKHIPILDNNEVIGMLSHTDLLRLCFVDLIGEVADNSDDLAYKATPVSQVMSKNIVTISISKSVKDVAEIFVKKEFNALPVLCNNKLIGIVTSTDLIKYLLGQF